MDNYKNRQLGPLALCIQGQRPWLPSSVFAGNQERGRRLCLHSKVKP